MGTAAGTAPVCVGVCTREVSWGVVWKIAHIWGVFIFAALKLQNHPNMRDFPFLAQSKKRTTSLRSIRMAPARPFRAVLPRAPS